MAQPPNQGDFRGFENQNANPGGEKAMPVLGQQPPLPGKTAVRLVNTEEEGNEQALVPAYPYYEKSQEEMPYANMQMMPIASSSAPKKASYQLSLNTLMFLANNGMGRPFLAQNQRLYKPVAPRPCYGCGGDHWYRDCPDRKEKPPEIPPIMRFCIDFAIKNLIQDCSSNPKFKGKATLNYVEIIPSSSFSSSKSEHIVPVKVINRAQAKA